MAKVAINQGHLVVRNRWPREAEASYFWSLEPCDKEGTLKSHKWKIYQLGHEAAKGLLQGIPDSIRGRVQL